MLFGENGEAQKRRAVDVKTAQQRRTHQAIRRRIGEPLGPMLGALFSIDGPTLDAAVKAYSTRYVEMAREGERPFAGAVPMLTALRAAGFKLAIATGKSQNGAERASERMGLAPLMDASTALCPGHRASRIRRC